MVCKELDELCAKFGTLSPHLRIDYIYGMLRMCLPPELRFIGSVVEDLAKKDFNFLREHENRANSQVELQKYSKVDEKTLIEGMAFNLSLLHSVNTACANIIFSLLEENLKSAFLISSTTDKKTIDIILLVLTMAKYHPAFTFHQRTTIAEYYKKVEQQLHDICAKSKTNDDRHSPNPLSSACYTCTVSTATKVHTPQATANHHTGHIVSLDVKQDKHQRRYDRKHEYRIQVTWANGEVTEISKTYHDIKDFYQKMCHHCSDKQDVVRQEGTSFYLGSPQKDDGPENVYQHVSSFVRHLSALSKTVKDKEGFIQFFKTENLNSKIPLPPTTTPDVPMTYDKPEDLETMFTPHTQTMPFTMFNSGFPQGELVSCIQPVPSGPYIGSPYRMPIYHSPPPSNHGSPVNSRSASPGDVDQITSLLGKVQLMKYKNTLEKLSYEQLSGLSMDVLVKDYGVNADDAARIMAELEERTREKLPNRLLNGRIVEPCIPGLMSHYPAWQYMQPPPQPVYPHHVMPPYHFPANVMVNKDSSSSENSSPSRSPVPQKKPQGVESSSDDSEKGNRVDSPYQDMRKKVRHPSHNREDTPPQTVSHAFDNVHGQSTGSGYQSDPTPGQFVRVIVANNSYITQPTHSNLNLPNKTAINMPESMGGRRIGLAFPYPRCDTQTTTVTSNSNNSGPDVNRRPMIPGQIPFIRPSTIGGSGRSFMCSVSNSTTPIMATNLQSNINGNIRTSSMPSAMSEPVISPSQNNDIQNGVTTSSQQSNGNPVSCSSTNGHSSSSHSQCTSCGCTGHSVPSYQFHVPTNQYIPTNQMFIPPIMSANPNGIVHHPFYHPVQYAISNGIPPNYLQAISHNHAFSNIPGAQYGCFPPVVLRRNSAGYSINNKQPRSTCSNCGSTDHISSECKENSMESMSASFHLKYDPKSNSD